MTDIIDFKTKLKGKLSPETNIEAVKEANKDIIEDLEFLLAMAKNGELSEVISISTDTSGKVLHMHTGFITNMFVMSSYLRKVSKEYEEVFCHSLLTTDMEANSGYTGED